MGRGAVQFGRWLATLMNSMLPPSTRQQGASWPTIETAVDQAVYLLWKCLFVYLCACYLLTYSMEQSPS